MDQTEQKPDLASITADIVSSYVANNSVHRGDLPSVIAAVHAALHGLANPAPAEPEKLQPAVSIRRSVTPDYLISLEDGKKYKTLKRHLANLGLTPGEYRAKWDLPSDYPIVAPSYAAKRSELAKSSGLGQLRKKGTAAKTAKPAAVKTVPAPEPAPKAKRRSAGKKGQAAA